MRAACRSSTAVSHPRLAVGVRAGRCVRRTAVCGPDEFATRPVPRRVASRVGSRCTSGASHRRRPCARRGPGRVCRQAFATSGALRSLRSTVMRAPRLAPQPGSPSCAAPRTSSSSSSTGVSRRPSSHERTAATGRDRTIRAPRCASVLQKCERTDDNCGGRDEANRPPYEPEAQQLDHPLFLPPRLDILDQSLLLWVGGLARRRLRRRLLQCALTVGARQFQGVGPVNGDLARMPLAVLTRIGSASGTRFRRTWVRCGVPASVLWMIASPRCSWAKMSAPTRNSRTRRREPRPECATPCPTVRSVDRAGTTDSRRAGALPIIVVLMPVSVVSVRTRALIFHASVSTERNANTPHRQRRTRSRGLLRHSTSARVMKRSQA